MDASVKTLDYSEENIKELEANGYKLSPVSKSYSKGKRIRYSEKRGVYWFSNRCSSFTMERFTKHNVGYLIYI